MLTKLGRSGYTVREGLHGNKSDKADTDTESDCDTDSETDKDCKVLSLS
jgi:hypothetical protein